MPVTCKLISGKYRIVGPDGGVETNDAGTPVDGKGHATREACMRQARAINSNLAGEEKAMSADVATGGGVLVGDEDIGEGAYKFSGSPKNRYGTHASSGFGGDYAKAWRLHFSQVGGGKLSGAASGPIRGTVRRTEMIAATMKPACSLPKTESVGARGGPKSPLKGSFSESPGDYGLSSWAKPDDPDDAKLTCSDLATIKRAALAEIKRRAKDREAAQKRDIYEEEDASKAVESLSYDEWFSVERRVEIIKAEDAKDHTLVFGAVLVPDKVDHQGDAIAADEIESAAHRFMEDSQTPGLMHEVELAKRKAVIVESYVAKGRTTVKGKAYPRGTWFAAMKVYDSKLRKMVRDGTLAGFSIGGRSRQAEGGGAG